MSLQKLNQAAQAYQQAAQEHAQQVAQVNGAQPVPGNDPQQLANTPPDQQNQIHLKPKQGGRRRMPPGKK